MEISSHTTKETPHNETTTENLFRVLTLHMEAVERLLHAPLPPCLPELAAVMTRYITWEIDGTCLHFHLADTAGASISGKLSTVRRDLDYMAQALLGHPEVQTVVGTSWIIAKNPKLMTRLGFNVEGNIDEETRARDYPHEARPMARATISRGDFLEQYLCLCHGTKKRGHSFP